MSVWSFLSRNAGEVLARTLEHLALVGVSTGLAVAIGVPLGLVITRRERLRGPILGFANVVQAIPSLALFGFLMPLPFIGGIGARTAIVALQLLRDDLAEQDGLGEVLAAHDHRLPATPQKRQERQERQERQKGQKPETGRSR